MKKVYIGPKQSTIDYTNFFDFSLTLFGNNDSTNFSYEKNLTFEYWNPDNNLKEKTIYNNLLKKLSPPYEVMAHDPYLIASCEKPKNIQQICINDLSLLKLLNNKVETRNLVKNIVPILNYKIVLGKDFDYHTLTENFGDKLVVQLPTGSGGSKTFVCTQKNFQDISSLLVQDKYYAISHFYDENIPYNIHCVIGEKEIELFAPSQQELEIIDKIEFIGSRYLLDIPLEAKIKMREYSMAICKNLQKLGYLGVLGIDYIFTENELYFIEINPRFQGSTRDLNKLLLNSDLPSLFEYNYYSFNGIELPSAKNMINSIFKK